RVGQKIKAQILTFKQHLEEKLLSFVEVETYPQTKKLLRVALLSWVLIYTLLMLPAHADFWSGETFGARFEFNGSPLRILSLPQVSPFYQLFIFCQMLTLVLGIAGYRPRLMVLLAFFFTENLQSNVDVTLDGGNNLSELIFTYLLFMDTSGSTAPRSPMTSGL